MKSPPILPPSAEEIINDPRNEYVALMLDSIRWTRVANQVRKFGWHESANQFIDKVRKAATWKGHTDEGRLHLKRLESALRLLNGEPDEGRMIHPTIEVELKKELGRVVIDTRKVDEWLVNARFAFVLDLIVMQETAKIENCQIDDAVRVLRDACVKAHADLGQDGPVRPVETT